MKEEKVYWSRELCSMIYGYFFLCFLGYFIKELIIDLEDSYFWMINDFIVILF